LPYTTLFRSAHLLPGHLVRAAEVEGDQIARRCFVRVGRCEGAHPNASSRKSSGMPVGHFPAELSAEGRSADDRLGEHDPQDLAIRVDLPGDVRQLSTEPGEGAGCPEVVGCLPGKDRDGGILDQGESPGDGVRAETFGQHDRKTHSCVVGARTGEGDGENPDLDDLTLRGLHLVGRDGGPGVLCAQDVSAETGAAEGEDQQGNQQTTLLRLIHGVSPSIRITSSTRRLAPLPSEESLDATGRKEAYPVPLRRSGAMSWPSMRRRTTARARSEDRSQLS